MMNFRTKIAILTTLAVVLGVYAVRTALQASVTSLATPFLPMAMSQNCN